MKAQPLLNSVQYRTQIVPLVGSPEDRHRLVGPQVLVEQIGAALRVPHVQPVLQIRARVAARERHRGRRQRRTGVGERIAGTVVVVTFMAYDWSVKSHPLLDSVQYRTQIVPLVGNPKTVTSWPTPVLADQVGAALRVPDVQPVLQIRACVAARERHRGRRQR